MRITAKQAMRLADKQEGRPQPSSLDLLCNDIQEAAIRGRRSLMLINWELSDDDKNWLSINGYIIAQADGRTLITWEYAST